MQFRHSPSFNQATDLRQIIPFSTDFVLFRFLAGSNPEQLWESTPDPNVRSPLQVKMKEADDADDIFTKPTGDEVDPHREFIQDNALALPNLDI